MQHCDLDIPTDYRHCLGWLPPCRFGLHTYHLTHPTDTVLLPFFCPWPWFGCSAGQFFRTLVVTPFLYPTGPILPLPPLLLCMWLVVLHCTCPYYYIIQLQYYLWVPTPFVDFGPYSHCSFHCLGPPTTPSAPHTTICPQTGSCSLRLPCCWTYTTLLDFLLHVPAITFPF